MYVVIPPLSMLWLLLLPECHLQAGTPALTRNTFAPRRPLLAATVAALAAAPARPASAGGFVDGWEASRQAKLQKMQVASDAQDALCAGRRAADIQDLSPFDMTFDPPCYISGYYEVIAAAVLLGALKIGQILESRSPSSDEQSTSEPPASRSNQDSLE